MKLPRWLTSLVVVIAMLPALPLPGAVAAPPPSYHPLGTGARFLPPASAFYLAFDLDPDSPQTRFLDRLSSLYARSPEADAAGEQLTERLGLSIPVEALIGDLRAALGSEIFIGMPTGDDWQRLRAFDSPFINLDCREPEFLVGAAIADLAGLRERLVSQRQEIEARGARTSAEQFGGHDVVRVAGRSAELAVYVTVADDYLLMSTSRSFLLDALDRTPSRSLAAEEAFIQARSHFQGSPLAFLYSSMPGDSLVYGGSGGTQEAATRWVAGALRLADDTVRVETASSVDLDRVSPATRMLLDKPSNPLVSASVAPADSAFFVGWHNLKLVWDRYVESEWPAPEQYAAVRRDAREYSGLDLEDDVFGWMTGEVALVLAPASDRDAGRAATIGRSAVGLVLEAPDPLLVAPKYDRIVQFLRREFAESNIAAGKVTEQQIAGVTFHRLVFSGDLALYTAMVGRWVVVTTDAGMAARIVTAIAGGGSLADQTEFARARGAMNGPLQFFGYISVPEFVHITTSGVGAFGGATDEELVAPYARPLRSAGLGVNTTAQAVDGVFAVHTAIPTEPLVFAADGIAGPQAQPQRPAVLMDLSRHGGAWTWGFSYTPGAPRPPLEMLLTDRLAAPLRTIAPGSHVGRLPRDVRGPALPNSSQPVVEPSAAKLAIRVGSTGVYEDDEIATYRDYVRCGGSLLLLSDAKAPGETDELAAAFGFQVAGAVRGDALLSSFPSHPATREVWPLSAAGGTGLISWDEASQPLGYLSAGSYLDLDGDGQRDDGEPTEAVAYAVRPYGRGTVAFLGTTSVLADPEHPVLGQLLRYLLPRAPWYMPDTAEPDNSASAARPLPLDGSSQHRSLYPTGDQDWATFELGEGQTALLLMTGGCGADVQVLGADGKTVLLTHKNAYAERSVIGFTAPATGRYYVSVQGGGNRCAAYVLAGSIRSAPSAPPVLIPAPVQLPH